MRRYSEAVQADVRRRMSPPHRQSVAQISQELAVAGGGGTGIGERPRGLDCCRQVHGGARERWVQCHGAQCLLQGAGPVPGTGRPLAADGPYRGQRPSVPEALDANANAVLTMAEQRDLEKRLQQDQKEIKQLKQDLRRKEKALAEAAALL